MRVADQVFESLSRAILSGELKPGQDLATQRELSVQFRVSPLVARQAIHRLEELGLVRVRQGSTTVVLDPNEAPDIRLLQLQLELATEGDALALAARENHALSALALLTLAQRRITDEELEVLEVLTAAAGDAPKPGDSLRFRLTYWGHVADSTRNPVLQQQVRWWTRLITQLGSRGGDAPTLVAPGPMSLYRALNAAFRRRSGAVEVWLTAIEPLFDWTEAQPGHAASQSGAALTGTVPKTARRQR